jgi:hypothetical protein
VIQARKGYVSLVTPRRTFARVQATTKNRVDLGLRLDGKKPGGRLQTSKLHETMKLQISFSTLEEVDAEALRWLKNAYEANCMIGTREVVIRELPRIHQRSTAR